MELTRLTGLIHDHRRNPLHDQSQEETQDSDVEMEEGGEVEVVLPLPSQVGKRKESVMLSDVENHGE